MTEKTADKALFIYLSVNLKSVIRNEVDNDIIIVTRIKSDLVSSRRKSCGAYYVEGIISVEGSRLDSYDVIDRANALPIVVAELSAADGGLEIEA